MGDTKRKRAPMAADLAKSDIPAAAPPLTDTAIATAAESIAAAEPIIATAATAQSAAPEPELATEFFGFGHDALAALAESQTAFAESVQTLAFEFATMTRSSISAAVEVASAMLEAKTLADAIELQAGFTRRSVDAMIDGSAKLSEIGAKLTAEASRPIFARFGGAGMLTDR